MEKKRSKGIVLLGIYLVLLGIFFTILVIAVLLFLKGHQELVQHKPVGELGVLAAALAFLSITVGGINIIRMKKVGWNMSFYPLLFFLIFGIYDTVNNFLNQQLYGYDRRIFFLVSMGMPLYFLTRPKVKEQFK